MLHRLRSGQELKLVCLLLNRIRRQEDKSCVCVHAAMTSAQLFIRLGADLMESSVGGWQIPDGPDQMVAAAYFYRAKATFRFRHQRLLIDDPTELRRGHERSPGNKMSWAIASKLKTCWITVAVVASFSFLQPLQTNSQTKRQKHVSASGGLMDSCVLSLESALKSH